MQVTTSPIVDPTSHRATAHAAADRSGVLHPEALHRAAESVLERAREVFAQHGVDALAVAGPVVVDISTSTRGASWSPGLPRRGRPARITLGIEPVSGRSMALASDVVAHEYAHHVIHHLLGAGDPAPPGEEGAMRESLADVIAVAVDRDWTIGEDLGGSALRSLTDPSSIPRPHHEWDGRGQPRTDLVHPAHMRDVVRLGIGHDNGGVHVNAGIPGHAAFLIGQRLGIDAMTAIHVDAIRSGTLVGSALRPVGFTHLAAATTQAARTRFGTGAADAVAGAWQAVGVRP